MIDFYSDVGDGEKPTRSEREEWVATTCGSLKSPEREVCVLCGKEQEVSKRQLCLADPCMLATGEKRAQCNKLAEAYLKLLG